MLDLEFSPEQDMLRETVRKVCATFSPLSVVRELEDDPVGYSPELWKQMAELDLIGLLLPEDHGGSAMSAWRESCSTRNWAGPSHPPPISPAPCCAPGRWPGGDPRAAGAVAGAHRRRRRHRHPGVVRAREQLRARRHRDAGGARRRRVPAHRDRSVSRPVRGRARAAVLVVLARTGDGPRDIDLFLVDPATDGVTLRQQLTVASDHHIPGDLRGRGRGRRGPHRRPPGRAGPRGTP